MTGCGSGVIIRTHMHATPRDQAKHSPLTTTTTAAGECRHALDAREFTQPREPINYEFALRRTVAAASAFRGHQPIDADRVSRSDSHRAAGVAARAAATAVNQKV